MGGRFSTMPHICPFCLKDIKSTSLKLKCKHVCENCILNWFKSRHTCHTCKINIENVYRQANQFMEILAMSTFIHVCVHRHNMNIEHLFWSILKLPDPFQLEKEYNFEYILQIVLGLKTESIDFNALQLKYKKALDTLFTSHKTYTRQIMTSIIRNGLHPTVVAYTVYAPDVLNPYLRTSLRQFQEICERGVYKLDEFNNKSNILELLCQFDFNADISDNEFMQYLREHQCTS